MKITAELFKIHFRTIVFPIAQSRSGFTKAMPVGKGCAVTSDQVCLSKVKVILVMLHESPHILLNIGMKVWSSYLFKNNMYLIHVHVHVKFLTLIFLQAAAESMVY